jgi:hypothetical protein
LYTEINIDISFQLRRAAMSVLKSRRFWTAVVGIGLNIITFVVSHYIGDPTLKELSVILIGGITTIAGILIASYTVEDQANIKAQAAVSEAREYRASDMAVLASIGEDGRE